MSILFTSYKRSLLTLLPKAFLTFTTTGCMITIRTFVKSDAVVKNFLSLSAHIYLFLLLFFFIIILKWFFVLLKALNFLLARFRFGLFSKKHWAACPRGTGSWQSHVSDIEIIMNTLLASIKLFVKISLLRGWFWKKKKRECSWCVYVKWNKDGCTKHHTKEYMKIKKVYQKILKNRKPHDEKKLYWKSVEHSRHSFLVISLYMNKQMYKSIKQWKTWNRNRLTNLLMSLYNFYFFIFILLLF